MGFSDAELKAVAKGVSSGKGGKHVALLALHDLQGQTANGFWLAGRGAGIRKISGTMADGLVKLSVIEKTGPSHNYIYTVTDLGRAYVQAIRAGRFADGGDLSPFKGASHDN